jgi:hypothetical protein
LEEMHAHRTPFYHAEKSFQSVGEFDDRFPVTQWVRVRFTGNKDHLWVRAGQGDACLVAQRRPDGLLAMTGWWL